MINDSVVNVQIIIEFDVLHNGVYPELFEPEIHERTFLFATWVRETIFTGGCDPTDCASCKLEEPPENPELLVRDLFSLLHRKFENARKN